MEQILRSSWINENNGGMQGKMARQINITLPTMMETLTKEIDGWMKSLKSALITMCESMAITLNDIAGHLREESEEKIK